MRAHAARMIPGVAAILTAAPDAASSQRDVCFGISALVFGHLEAENPGVEVNRGAQVRGEDLKSQRHLHPRMVATYHQSP
jgi:hypothetical protein